MAQEVLYLKLDKDVAVEREDVFLKDVGKVYCTNDTIVNKCKALKITKIQKEKNQKKIISVMKIIELIGKEFPSVTVINIGETDVLIERIEVITSQKYLQILKIIFVAAISFFGTMFTIMAFHNDIGIQPLFSKFYELIMGEPSGKSLLLEISYSLGLGAGIIIFFNHIGGRRITKDPTPIEVEMRIYERDVNDTLIETSQREEKEIEIS